jgi:hypothetical protein
MNSSFVHIEYPTHHGAIDRYEGVVANVKEMRKSFGGLAAVLLAAMVSALLVVADQLMDTWVEGHLLAAWVLLWLIGFAAVALLAPAARNLAKRLIVRLDAWSQSVARRRADERLWEMARTDGRIMADLRAAKNRAEAATEEAVRPVANVKAEGAETSSIRPAIHISYL